MGFGEKFNRPNGLNKYTGALLIKEWIELNPANHLQDTLGEIRVNIQQLIGICGMLSPIMYTMMWIVGGFLRSDYSHIRDDVSSLTATGAP